MEENPLMQALMGGYDPRQAGPPPDPRMQGGVRPGQGQPIGPAPNPQEAPWRPGGGAGQSWWGRIKQAIPFQNLGQPGHGGPGGGSSPWGGS